MPALPAATDAELVTRSAEGEREAFIELFERHADRVHDHLARWTRDTVLAAEATREAFAALLREVDSVPEGHSVLAWLLRAARRHAVDQLRGEPGGGEDLDSRIATVLLAATTGSRVTSPGATATSRDTAGLVWEVAAGLDEATFTVLDLDVRQELGGPGIAAVTDTTPQVAAELVDRTRERVRTLFGATVLLRVPHRDCPRLESLRAGARDPLDPATARRIQEHAEQCVTCGPRRARAADPLDAYAALTQLRAPVSVRHRTMAAATEHLSTTPTPWGRRRVLPLGVALLVLLGVVGGMAAALRSSDADPDGGPPTAAAEPVASPVPEPTPSPTATLEALASASPVPVPSPEPTVAPEPTPWPSPSPSPSPTPSPTADPSPSPQPLAVTIDAPRAGELFAATAEDDQGRQAARVPVAATVAGGGQGTSVAWTSDRAPEQVLLDRMDGEVVLWLSEACTDTVHVLTVTVSGPSGEAATATVEVQVTETCTPPLTVSIDEPPEGARFQRNPEDDTVTFSVAASASDSDVTWTWTSDRAPSEPLLEAQRGEVEVVVEDCTSTTSFTLFVDVERESDGSTATDEVVVEVDCAA